MAQELRVLREDRDSWKLRLDQLLEKYDRIDPAYVEHLRQECEELKRQQESMVNREEHEKILEECSQKLEETSNRFDSWRQNYKRLLAQSQNIVKNRDEFSKRVAELEAQSIITSVN